MNGWCDQNSFAKLAGKGKNRPAYMCPRSFIKKTVFSFSRSDMKFLFTDHVVEFICINSCRIYNTVCLKNSVCCLNRPVFLSPCDLVHFCIEIKIHSVCTGIFCQCDRHVEWTYNSSAGCVQCRHSLVRNIRLHFSYFFFI